MSSPSNISPSNRSPNEQQKLIESTNRPSISNNSSLSSVADEKIREMSPSFLKSSSTSTSPVSSGRAARLSAASGSPIFSLPSTPSLIGSRGETPEEDKELEIARKKLGNFGESIVQKFAAFLKENKEVFQALEKNVAFRLEKQDVEKLGLKSKGSLEFVPWGSCYHTIELLIEGEKGYFVASGAKKKVTSARKTSFLDGVGTVSYVAQQVIKFEGERAKQIIKESVDIVKNHHIATKLEAEGLYLVASKSYRIGCELLIVQPLAPAIKNELINGVTLVQALKMLLDISKGVSDLHEREYAHRDLKPDNIGNIRGGSGEENRYRLNDFDLLHPATSPIISGEKEPGSPTYMSPEICRSGSACDLKKCDVWSFGITALEILFSTDATSPQAEFPPHPFVPAKEAPAVMYQVGNLKEEGVIDTYFEKCIAEKPHLAPIYELVRKTLHIKPGDRIEMKIFHEKLAALAQQMS